MSNIKWWNNGSKTSDWAMGLLPILVRQARSRRPLTYGSVAEEVGMSHHRPVQRAAGHIGYALDEIGSMRGWRRRPPPAIQSLIINKTTGLPGHGVNGFMNRQYRQAKTKAQREAALLTAHAAIYAYPYWEDVMRLLDIDPTSADLEALTNAAVVSRNRGGEGPEHKALKEYVASNPTVVGLSPGQARGTTEWQLPSGDRIDVVFVGRGRRTAIEVKSHISSVGDVARGVYQCVKYRAVLEAQASVSEDPFDVSVILVFGGELPGEATELANAFGVRVLSQVSPS